MKRALFFVFALVACDPGPPKVDDVRIADDSFDPPNCLKYEVDSTTRGDDVLYGKVLPNGIQVAEGFAAVIRVQPLWKKYSTPTELEGVMTLTSAAPDVFSIEPVPNEGRRFIIAGKKVGTTTVQVTVDGAQGSKTIPINVIVQPPP
jgi:hypothetical protein